MFHSHTLPVNKSGELSSYSGEGSCRVVATTAIVMGLNFHMWSSMGYQRMMKLFFGRPGRDGSQSHAVVCKPF